MTRGGVGRWQWRGVSGRGWASRPVVEITRLGGRRLRCSGRGQANRHTATRTAVHSMRRDVAAQRERGTEVIALSGAQGFPFWLGLGRTFHAAAGVAAGDPRRSLTSSRGWRSPRGRGARAAHRTFVIQEPHQNECGLPRLTVPRVEPATSSLGSFPGP